MLISELIQWNKGSCTSVSCPPDGWRHHPGQTRLLECWCRPPVPAGAGGGGARRWSVFPTHTDLEKPGIGEGLCRVGWGLHERWLESKVVSVEEAQSDTRGSSWRWCTSRHLHHSPEKLKAMPAKDRDISVMLEGNIPNISWTFNNNNYSCRNTWLAPMDTEAEKIKKNKKTQTLFMHTCSGFF